MTDDKNKKPERIYIRDRIQRIKENVEQSKQNDPNWYSNAPKSLISDYDEELPLNNRVVHSPSKEVGTFITENDSFPVRLTKDELTNYTIDSSQLAQVMRNDNNKYNSKSMDAPGSHLEQSRRNKMLEREEANRRVAENLDKASERWHTHMKVIDNVGSTLDSSAVQMSMFGDDQKPVEMYHEVKREKEPDNRQVSTDYVERLNTLHRTHRSSLLSKSSSNIRSLNERPYSSWTSKDNRFSSVWDLKYSLLHNRVNPSSHRNFFTPPILSSIHSVTFDKKYKEPHLHSESTKSFNKQQLSKSLFNISDGLCNDSENSPCYEKITSPPYLSSQFAKHFSQLNSNSSCPTNHHPFRYNECSNHYPESYSCVQMQWPITSCHPDVHQSCYQQTQMHSNIINPPVQSNTSSTPTNNDLANTMVCVSQRISDISEKLNKLNCVIEQLTSTQSTSQTKSIVKPLKKHRDILLQNDEVDNDSCKFENVLSDDHSLIRRVRFANTDNLQDSECTTSSKDNLTMNLSELKPNSMVDFNHRRTRDFRAFALPTQATSILLSDRMRHSHTYFRDAK